MILATHRFHGHNSLNFVYRHGKTVRSGQISLKFCENPKRQTYRSAVVVSKKVHKSAVVRNRIRRRIYEIIRLNQAKITKPYDLVFTVFSDQLAIAPHQELLSTVQSALKSAKIVK
ncbi:MAG: ribonuclease P protein component [Patescibacteria group bacterium]